MKKNHVTKCNVSRVGNYGIGKFKNLTNIVCALAIV